MKHNRKTAAMLSGIVMLATIAASCVVFTYLPAPSEQLSLTIVCVICGLIASALVYFVVTALPDRRRWRCISLSLFLILGAVPIFSGLIPQITYARFGFTVYGATPIPFLDITVNRKGVLWFRPKTHLITRAELDALITPDVEIVVVGIGWDSVARLSNDAQDLATKIDLRIMSTPEAFSLYNKLKAEGRIVVLLAHCTC